MSIILSANEAQGYKEKLGVGCSGQTPSILPTHGSRHNFDSNTPNHSCRIKKNSTWNFASLWQVFGRKSQGRKATVSNPGILPSTPRLETYLCADKCWTSIKDTRLSVVHSVETMSSDHDFFCQVRRVLCETEGNWLQRKLSWRSYTRVNLSKVSCSTFLESLTGGRG